MLNIAVSGFLLIVKKDFDWIQPPTQKSEGGSVAQFITIEKLYEIVLSQDHPDFKLPTDIDRIDVRPGKAIYKVKSEHNYSEIQVDAVSGKVLSRATRNSDLIEKLHDGLINEGLIDSKTPLEKLTRLFSNDVVEDDLKIKWLSDNLYLGHLIFILKTYQYSECDYYDMITTLFKVFIDSKGNQIKNLRQSAYNLR
ncbi:hypothetical protein HN843_00605, partial [bacterium]|nr:hypothetical protein [bacterium]